MRVGSLFSGIGGLDLAVGGRTAWLCEADKHARRVLEHRFPGVDIIPDVREIDAGVDPVDVLVGGYPCQPFSVAGRRGGEADERHLWPEFARLIRLLRPRYVFAENVSGHLALGFDSVLCDLAEAGFDAEWLVVRASDVGAPHRRERLFVLASDSRRVDPERRRAPGIGTAGKGQGDGGQWERVWDASGDRGSTSPDADREHRGERRVAASGQAESGRAPTLNQGRGRARALADTPDQRRDRNVPDGTGGVPGQPRDQDCEATTDPDRDGRSLVRGKQAEQRDVDGRGRPHTAWGPYEPAIRQWEHVLGRHAPAPVDDRGRLNPAFVEWMMGLPGGWVTDPAVGVSRTQALKMLGNGVVPHQAAFAFDSLADALVTA